MVVYSSEVPNLDENFGVLEFTTIKKYQYNWEKEMPQTYLL